MQKTFCIELTTGRTGVSYKNHFEPTLLVSNHMIRINENLYSEVRLLLSIELDVDSVSVSVMMIGGLVIHLFSSCED